MREEITFTKGREIPLGAFPSPAELWQRYRAWRGLSDEAAEMVAHDYHSEGGGKEPRYYQRIAINRAVEAVTGGQDRVLLVMATGTGKAYTAYVQAVRDLEAQLYTPAA